MASAPSFSAIMAVTAVSAGVMPPSMYSEAESRRSRGNAGPISARTAVRISRRNWFRPSSVPP